MRSSKSLPNRLNFALVIGAEEKLRNSIVRVLKERGWLVHGISRTEHAFGLLAHIPYNLIVLDSELPGISEADLVAIVQDARVCRAIRLVIITRPDEPNLASELAGCGALVARRWSLQDDLSGLLTTCRGEAETSKF
jgi:DNA-binding response OmpR family regulator